MPIQYFYKLDKNHWQRRIINKVENHLQRKVKKKFKKYGNILSALLCLTY